MEIDVDYQLVEYYPTNRKYEENREEFYKDKIALEDFDKLYEENIENPSSQLTFYDKFSIYFSKFPDTEVWAPLSLIYNGKGKKVYRWMAYSISTSGRLWSHVHDKELLPTEKNNGYCSVNIRNGSNRTGHMTIHRAVLSAFTHDVSLPKENLTVNHKDPDIKTNHLLNLEWTTSAKNIRDAKLRNGFSVEITLTKDFEGYNKGEIYYAHRCYELTDLGINKCGINNSFRKGHSSYGCIWKRVEDKPTNLPIDLAKQIANYRK